MEKVRLPNLVLVRMGTSTIELVDHGDLKKLELRMQKLQARYPHCSYAIYRFVETNTEDYPLDADEDFFAQGGHLKEKLKDGNHINYLQSKQCDPEIMKDIPEKLRNLPTECYIFYVQNGKLMVRLNPDYEQILSLLE